jgi:sugar phosphate isomerase/epimerase
MRIGYNTNGFPHHRLEDAIVILAELGYQSIAITLDYHALNPFSTGLSRQLEQVRRLLEQHHLGCVIETGARFLLDPRRKHQPTLLDPDPAERVLRLSFLCQAMEIAAFLQADAVSFWSGTPVSEEPAGMLYDRLGEMCRRLAVYAGERDVQLAFEPEPGMFIATLDQFALLREQVDHPSFGLTIDIGHLHCNGESPLAEHIRPWTDVLWNIHIEDMRRGVHEHLMLGEGEIDFEPVFATLQEIDYRGGVHVELSRHGHDAVRAARRAMEFLSRWQDRTGVFPSSRGAGPQPR